MHRGDIYIANLNPVVGAETAKTRPVLIISNELNNTYSQTVTVLPISSSVGKIYPFEVLLVKSISGLNLDSKVKANQIRTIDKQRLIKRISILPMDVLLDVEKALLIHLGVI